MSLRLLKLMFVVVAVAVLGCGKSQVRILEPADGATYPLPQSAGQPGGFQYLAVTLENYDDYADTTISVRGDLPPGEVVCNGGAGAQLICQYVISQAQGGMSGQTCMPSCSVTFVATKGDTSDFRTVKFVRQGYTGK